MGLKGSCAASHMAANISEGLRIRVGTTGYSPFVCLSRARIGPNSFCVQGLSVTRCSQCHSFQFLTAGSTQKDVDKASMGHPKMTSIIFSLFFVLHSANFLLSSMYTTFRLNKRHSMFLLHLGFSSQTGYGKPRAPICRAATMIVTRRSTDAKAVRGNPFT